MDFSIVTDTAGASVSELSSDLRDLLVDKINKKYEKYNISIGIAIRCLPDSYGRRSFVRYTKSDNYLTIDFCVSVEEYETKYAVEQQFELGKTFLLWLDKGLMNEAFRKNNPDFDSNSLKEYIIALGKEHSWFSDTIDWSLVE